MRFDSLKKEFMNFLNIDPNRKILAMLPGSRVQEVRRLLPVMIRAGRILKRDIPELQILIAQSPTLSDGVYRGYTRNAPEVRSVRDLTHDVLKHADAALVASGTATLEAALAGTPMAVLYKMAPFSYVLARMLVRVPHIGLVNIVAGRGVVPELIQGAAAPKQAAAAVRPFLIDPDQAAEVRTRLSGVSEKLGEPGAANRAAEAVLNELDAAS